MKISILPQFILEFCRISWLSISSPKFYRDLYRHYKGLGIKYIAMIITITSIIFMSFNYITINTLKEYLISSEDNPVTQILSQIPTMEYRLGQIHYDGEPIVISNDSGKDLIAIDPNKKLTQDQRKNIPFILEKNLFSTNFKHSRILNNATFNYIDLFGSEDTIIDSNFIKEILIKGLDSINLIFVAIVTPIVILISIAGHIYQHLYLALITFIFLLLIGLRPSIRSAFRITMFTTGAPVLVGSILFILSGNIVLVNQITAFAQFWTLFLAGFSLVRR